MRWQQITVKTTTFGSDIVAMFLTDEGSAGVVIKDYNDIAEALKNPLYWDYVDDNLKIPEADVLVSGFFDNDYTPRTLEELLAKLKSDAQQSVGSLELSRSFIDSEDWENEWRKFYEPIYFNNFAVVPAWKKLSGYSKTQVFIEPGRAFGTGKHETTGMCLKFLDGLTLKDVNCYDIGCGSGILGITALMLGAKYCAFNDIDEEAVSFTSENLALNGISSDRFTVTADICSFKNQADLIIANITADILMSLKSDFLRLLKPDGLMIMSGIIYGREREISDFFAKDFTTEKTNKTNDWFAFLLRKKK